jgi:aminobutyraldehyde dehydrogenase
MYTQMLIGGELVGGEGEVEAILDSATGAQIASVPGASAAQVEAAVIAAENAFPGWARTPPRERATLMLRIADRIEAEAAEYAALESRNTGKPLAAMLNDELPSIADTFRYLLACAARLRDSPPGSIWRGTRASSGAIRWASSLQSLPGIIRS